MTTSQIIVKHIITDKKRIRICNHSNLQKNLAVLMKKHNNSSRNSIIKYSAKSHNKGRLRMNVRSLLEQRNYK